MLNSTNTTQVNGPPHFVDLHVNPGESVSIQFYDGNETILRGPTTIKMISQHAYPPMPMPVQVPPGHMIQQIVDENGTLRHIILSTLSNGTGNGFTSQTHISQQQVAAAALNPAFCCCCYNTCNNANNSGQTNSTATASGVAAAAVASQQPTQQQLPQQSQTTPLQATTAVPPPQPSTQQPLQPLPSQPVAMFPLNASSYVRPRRSNRNFPSPNNKRLSNYSSSNYYGTMSSSTKGSNQNRYKLDSGGGAKSSHYGRHSTTSMHMSDPARAYESTTVTTSDSGRYLHKSHDYTSFNSSNPLQTTVLDPINDHVKYYKGDSCPEENHKKKPCDSVSVDTSKSSVGRLSSCSIKVNSVCTKSDTKSQKSTLGDSIEPNHSVGRTYNHYEDFAKKKYNTTLSEDKSAGDIYSDQTDDETCHNAPESNVPQVIPSRLKSVDGCVTDISINDKSTQSPNYMSSLQSQEPSEKDPLSSDPVSEPENEKSQCTVETAVATDEAKSPHQSRTIQETAEENCLKTRFSDHTIQLICDEDDEDEEDDDDEDDDDDDSEKSNSDHEQQDNKQSQLPQQRSPRHLLPKVEALNLSFIALSPTSVRLKWYFIHPSDDSEHKKHFMVDLLQGNIEDSSSSRTVYQGHTISCRVSHLQPQHEYTFRVRTTGQDVLYISNLLTVFTPEQQPSSAKVSGRRSRQQLQQQIYQQREQISHQNQLLEQHKLVESRQMMPSNATSATLAGSLVDNPDQRYAFLILTGFTGFALVVAALIQQLMSAN